LPVWAFILKDFINKYPDISKKGKNKARYKLIYQHLITEKTIPNILIVKAVIVNEIFYPIAVSIASIFWDIYVVILFLSVESYHEIYCFNKDVKYNFFKRVVCLKPDLFQLHIARASIYYKTITKNPCQNTN
jgi:hypothetical protein